MFVLDTFGCSLSLSTAAHLLDVLLMMLLLFSFFQLIFPNSSVKLCCRCIFSWHFWLFSLSLHSSVFAWCAVDDVAAVAAVGTLSSFCLCYSFLLFPFYCSVLCPLLFFCSVVLLLECVVLLLMLQFAAITGKWAQQCVMLICQLSHADPLDPAQTINSFMCLLIKILKVLICTCVSNCWHFLDRPNNPIIVLTYYFLLMKSHSC